MADKDSITKAVPLLRVTDMERSIDWYRGGLGFVADPFPAQPYEFAILRHGQVELMLRLGAPPPRLESQQYGWDVYLRLEGPGFRELYDKFRRHNLVKRFMERMPSGLAEFEVTDPDGNIICLSQELESMSDLPAPQSKNPN